MDDVIERHISDTRRMKPYKPSMCLDWEAGRPLEYEVILGNFLKFSQRKGVQAPECEQLALDLRCVIS